MDDERAEMLSTLRKKLRTDDRSVAARRVVEAKPMAYSARRPLTQKTDRTEQTNLKFTPAFKKKLVALALKADQSLTEYIEQAVNEREERGW